VITERVTRSPQGAISAALFSTYGNYEFIVRAADESSAEATNHLPRLEVERSGTNTQLLKALLTYGTVGSCPTRI
jgi:hypothetical protein